MPKISVVMPVYNGELYVEDAVKSILAQTFADFEFIIIDDGSSDRTSSLLYAAAASDRRIQVVPRENRGIVKSLNEGLALAEGDWIARMDADDIALPDRFARQLAYLGSHPECGVLGGQILITDPEDRPLMRMSQPLDHDKMVAAQLAGVPPICHPTVMFRRDIARAIGGYSDRFQHAEDADFFLRMAEKTRLANLPDIVLRYRQHFKSIGFVQADAQSESYNRATAEAAVRMGIALPAPVKAMAHDKLDDIYERWAWWALNDKFVDTSRYYAKKVVRQKPFRTASWRLLACAIRGH